MSSIRYPAEILGVPVEDGLLIDTALTEAPQCPFTHGRCVKKNQTCSVRNNRDLVAVCPHRFLDRNLVFKDIARRYFGDEHDLLLFREVASGDKSLGTFDFVMAKHRPMSSEIVDFVVIELQTVDTTSTGKLNDALKDYRAGQPITDHNYGFGLNWANVWKRCFIQILNKGRVLEHWGHKAFWVVQDPAIRHLVDGYGLASALQPGIAGSTVFMIYDLIPRDNQRAISLESVQIVSASMQELLKAFASNERVPSKAKFVQRLEQKSERSLTLSLQWK
jgi:hypothetical protein